MVLLSDHLQSVLKDWGSFISNFCMTMQHSEVVTVHLVTVEGLWPRSLGYQSSLWVQSLDLSPIPLMDAGQSSIKVSLQFLSQATQYFGIVKTRKLFQSSRAPTGILWTVGFQYLVCKRILWSLISPRRCGDYLQTFMTHVCFHHRRMIQLCGHGTEINMLQSYTWPNYMHRVCTTLQFAF